MKYLVYKDYLAGEHYLGYDYQLIEAADDFEAVSIADSIWKEESHKLYLMRILKKAGKVRSGFSKGWKEQDYKAVICKRSEKCGWHKNDAEHCENEHIITLTYKSDKPVNGGLMWYID